MTPEHEARLERIKASQAGTVQPDETILFLLDAVDALRVERDTWRVTALDLTEQHGCDADFTAHARSDVPDLLAALDAERATSARLRTALRSRAIAATLGGMACRLCSASWRRDAPERHAEGCALATGEGDAQAGPELPLHEYPTATEATICERCGERGHWWCSPSRVRFTGRARPRLPLDDGDDREAP